MENSLDDLFLNLSILSLTEIIDFESFFPFPMPELSHDLRFVAQEYTAPRRDLIYFFPQKKMLVQLEMQSTCGGPLQKTL